MSGMKEVTEAAVKLADMIVDMYKDFKPNDLNQVFMRGPFAGWSERQLYEFGKRLKKENEEVPIKWVE